MHSISEIIYTAMWEHPLRIMLYFIAAVSLIATIIAAKFTGLPPNKTPSKTPADVSYNTRRAFTILACIGVGVYVSLIPAWEDFTYWDSDLFFPTMTSGYQWYPPPIWPAAGRLFPLAHQEFSLLSKLSPTAFFFHAFAAIEMIALVCLTGAIIGGRWLLPIILCLVTTPAIAQAYFALIYPERNMIILIAILLLGATAWKDRNSRFGFSIACTSGATLLLYKETAFLLTGSMASVLFVYWLLGSRTDTSKSLLMLAYGLLMSCAVWIIVYCLAILPEIQNAYGSTSSISRTTALLAVLKEPWAFALLLYCATRAKTAINSVFTDAPLWDGLALAALTYTLAMVTLRFNIPYYYAPPAFISWVLLAKVLKSWKEQRYALTALGILFSIQITETVDLVKHKKELVNSKASAARFIAEDSRSHGSARIHFLTTDAYEAGLFSGFLGAKYGTKVTTIIEDQRKPIHSKRCTPSPYMPLCTFDSPIETGDYIVSFGSPLPNPQFPLVYTSEPIGFWNNQYRSYVYVAKFPPHPG